MSQCAVLPPGSIVNMSRMLLSTEAGKPIVCFAATCVRHSTAHSLAQREGTGGRVVVVGEVGGATWLLAYPT